MNAVPMIARCLKHNADVHPIGYEWDVPNPPHPNTECLVIAMSSLAETVAPNLLLWTGRQHKLVLTIKP